LTKIITHFEFEWTWLSIVGHEFIFPDDVAGWSCESFVVGERMLSIKCSTIIGGIPSSNSFFTYKFFSFWARGFKIEIFFTENLFIGLINGFPILVD